MNKMLSAVWAGIIMTLIIAASPGQSVAKTLEQKPYDKNQVMLPMQSINGQTGLIPVSSAAISSDWKSFFAKNGKWQLNIDRVAGTPRMAFGEPIAIKGFERVDENNIELAATSFLRENEKLFNISTNNLKLSRKDFVNGKWYLSYKQYYQGVEVLLAGIEIRINSEGKVFFFDVEYYNIATLGITPKISKNEAIENSGRGMQTKSKLNKSMASEKLYILPHKYTDRADFHLVYKVNVSPAGESARYTTYVSALDGSIAWRYNNFMNADVIEVKGYIKEKNPNDAVVTKAMPYIYIEAGNKTYTSDSEGKISAPGEAAVVNAALEGPFVKVTTQAKNPGRYSGNYNPGQPLNIIFDDNNSHRYERNVYYYVNNARKFLQELDPKLTFLDTQFVVELRFEPDQMFGENPNAFSAGDTIVFINCQNNSARLADGPSVLYHEYGHSVNTMFYTLKGRENGMVNMTCHEALADLTSAAILDESEVGIGVFTDDTLKYIRNLKNNLIYPDSINGESHHDSQILSGALWDLREKTSLELLRKLHHYARYGLPDDPNTGLAFYKWLIEILIADDDDGNLANKTPHYNEIIESFDNHRIGAMLFYLNNFSHIALDDTPNTTQPYKVEFNFGDDTQALVFPDSATVTYRVKYNKELSDVYTVTAVKTQSNGLSFKAIIPPQKKYSEVLYNIHLHFSNPTDKISYGMNTDTKPYDFLVGYGIALFDPFEQDNKWSTSTEGDNATVGKWERGMPFEIDFGGMMAGILKPGQDHSQEGEKYYSTGLTGIPQGRENDPFAIMQYLIPNGITTLTSRVIDISLLENPIFKYYIFFRQYKLVFGDESFNPKLEVLVSNNGGNDWVTVSEDTSSGIAGWVKTKFRFDDYLEPTNNCKIRFRYHTRPGFFGYPAALASVSIDDFEILSANDEIVNGVDEEETYNNLNISPNPFMNTANVIFPAAGNGICKIGIYSLQGEQIYSKEIQTAGQQGYFVWNGAKSDNHTAAPGIYLIKIISGANVLAGKIIKQ